MTKNEVHINFPPMTYMHKALIGKNRNNSLSHADVTSSGYIAVTLLRIGVWGKDSYVTPC